MSGEPNTEAGRALLDSWDDRLTTRGAVLAAVKRVEAEAAADCQREVEALRTLVRELAEEVHQTGSHHHHADPNDKTGWNVHGIETCTDPLCVEALAAAEPPATAEERP